MCVLGGGHREGEERMEDRGGGRRRRGEEEREGEMEKQREEEESKGKRGRIETELTTPTLFLLRPQTVS